ncbi:MAG: hypothetical protein ACLQBK_06785 [Candidatus Sulfotelmatobacter sp.]
MISEEKMLEAYTVRQRWLEEYAHQQMEKFGLFKEGWKFEIAGFYEEEMQERGGKDKLLGQCIIKTEGWKPRIVVYPTLLRLSKLQQKQTVLHEIAHALVTPVLFNTEDHHGRVG